MSNKSWFVFKDNFGTTEEKSFVKYFDSFINKIQDKYDEIHLIRNERQLKLFSFDEGKRFEPDYLLILNKKDREPKYYHVFIEVKGTIYLQPDEGKEDFLLQIEKLGTITIADDEKYRIIGLPFFNLAERFARFDTALNNVINLQSIKM